MKLRWLALALSALLLGCSVPLTPGPSASATLVLRDGDRARTLLPPLPAGVSYVVHLSQPGQANFLKVLSDLSSPITQLNPGPWHLVVDVTSPTGTLLAQSPGQDVQIGGQGATTATVLFAPVGTGTGSVGIDLQWPTSLVDSVSVSLDTWPTTNPNLAVTTLTSPQVAAGSWTLAQNAAAGTYLLRVSTRLGGVTYPDLTEIVQVWPGLTSTGVVDIQPAQLDQIPAAPSNLVMTQTGKVITLTWQDNSDNETGFNVYSGTLFQTNIPAGVNIYYFNGNLGGNSLSVSAYNARGESAQSASASLLFMYIETVDFASRFNVPVGDATIAPPYHVVSSLKAFSLGKTEVTYPQWFTMVQWGLIHGYGFGNLGSEPGGTVGAPPSGQQLPVVQISWRDAVVWCNAFSEWSGLTPVYYTDSGFTQVLKQSTNGTYNSAIGTQDNPYIDVAADGYHLPTEAEWESAALYPADNSAWASGASGPTAAESGAVGWFSPAAIQLVAIKPSNTAGLYDMSGNVAELCQDWYQTYTSLSPFIDADTLGPTSPTGMRIVRGGSVADDLSVDPALAAASRRSQSSPNVAGANLGFRVALGSLAP